VEQKEEKLKINSHDDHEDKSDRDSSAQAKKETDQSGKNGNDSQTSTSIKEHFAHGVKILLGIAPAIPPVLNAVGAISRFRDSGNCPPNRDQNQLA